MMLIASRSLLLDLTLLSLCLCISLSLDLFSPICSSLLSLLLPGLVLSPSLLFLFFSLSVGAVRLRQEGVIDGSVVRQHCALCLCVSADNLLRILGARPRIFTGHDRR